VINPWIVVPRAACKGFRLRGHVFTDAEGRYSFRTIMPGIYPGRTRHYHVKVQVPNRPVLTTQFYFPDEKGNLADEFLHSELVMRVAAADDSLRARFDVVLARLWPFWGKFGKRHHRLERTRFGVEELDEAALADCPHERIAHTVHCKSRALACTVCTVSVVCALDE
jgi:hypothetical protein